VSLGRYLLLKTAVGFALFVVFLFPTLFLTGAVASLLPESARGVGVFAVGLSWLVGMMLGTHVITEKLSRRWSR
jgi:hypothetical protein